MMLSRSSLGRNAPRVVRKQCIVNPSSRRGMAAAAAPRGFEYETGESVGVKFANRDVAGPTTTLALVAKAGARYQPLPGYSDLLAKYAFNSTAKRSALRITREVELLGGEVSSHASRENIVLTAKFLRDDLPYFMELLAEVTSQTKFQHYDLNEHIGNLVKFTQNDLAANPVAQALESVHGVAFHSGLGSPVQLPPSAPLKKYLSTEAVAEFAKGAYAKPSIAVVSSGADTSAASKWVKEFFTENPATAASGPMSPKASQPTKYFGGEERIPSTAGNAVVIAFPGSSSFGTASSYKPEVAVLAALLGGQSNIKWSTGSSLLSKAVEPFRQVNVSTSSATYSDAGLLYTTITGKADSVAAASKAVVDTIKKVAAGDIASEDIKKATALAKFRALEAGQNLSTGIELTGSSLIHGGRPFQIAEVGQSIDKVTEQQVKAAAKDLLSNKASVSSVGDLYYLPYAADLGLTV